MYLTRHARLRLEPGHPSPIHQHAEGQLFYLYSGAISLINQQGRHLLPPGCLAWVPPEIRHGAEVHQAVLAQRLYLDADWARLHLPSELSIVRATALITELLSQVVELQSHKAAQQLYLTCLADAYSRQAKLPLTLVMPSHPRLLAVCQQCLSNVQHHYSLEQLAELAHMSRRSLSRHFLQETGISVGVWLQQMRIHLALEKLVSGQSVTQIAWDLGYQSLSAFITQFRHHIGVSPGNWQSAIRQNEK